MILLYKRCSVERGWLKDLLNVGGSEGFTENVGNDRNFFFGNKVMTVINLKDLFPFREWGTEM